MFPSIPDSSWQVRADDPMALTCLLNLPGMVVTGVEYDAIEQTQLLLCAHTEGSAVCPTCGHRSSAIHQSTHRAVRDLPWVGKPVWVEFAARRFWCWRCQHPFQEALSWLPRCSRLTERYREFVFEQCRRTSIQAVSEQQRLGYRTVERLYYALAQALVQATPRGYVRQLGIDEFAIKKGHDQFALALSDLQDGRIFCVLPDRKKETLQAYLATWSPEQREAVEEVAMDLWEPYALAVGACLPQARIVADRFHVMKSLNDQVTAARRDIQRTLPEESKQTLKGCRWLLVRNEADLSEEEKARLEAMFAVAPTLQQLHRLKEDFRDIFEARIDPLTAEPRLQEWISSVEASALMKLNKFVATLRHRWEHILNYFHNRLTSGKVEGLNNKVKVLKRCAYGFRNFRHFTLRIQIECDGVT
jgi:transposase